MTSPVSTIRNLGPAMEEACRRAGITSAEQLRGLGADEAFRLLVENGTRPQFIIYRVIFMGLQDRPWQESSAAEKKMLRERYDAIVASTRASGLPETERTLDQIGTGLRR